MRRDAKKGSVPFLSRPPLGLLVFVVGASSLGAEIAAARLVAPYFGASTVIWANTIATVLLALSAGYWLGGIVADRAPHLRGLCGVILAAAVLLALVPVAGRPLLETSAEEIGTAPGAGELFGSLAAIVLLVAPPVLLLGIAAPYAVRLSLPRVEEAGATAGRLYAISTVGSLVGVWLSALVLIPFLGTRLTFLTFAAALAIVAAPGVIRAPQSDLVGRI